MKLAGLTLPQRLDESREIIVQICVCARAGENGHSVLRGVEPVWWSPGRETAPIP